MSEENQDPSSSTQPKTEELLQQQRLDTLRRLLQRSLIRANIFQPPWIPEQENQILDLWCSSLLRVSVVEQWPMLFALAHETRSRAQFNRMLTVDDLLFVWRKLKGGMKWNSRSDQWEDPSGGFYAVPNAVKPEDFR